MGVPSKLVSNFPRYQATFAPKPTFSSFPATFASSPSLAAGVSPREPTALAALEFLTSSRTSDLCSVAARAYTTAVLAGATRNAATTAAEEAYIAAFDSGERNTPGSPCAAAEASFQAAPAQDAVLAAAEAYMAAAPATACGHAGSAYLRATLGGQSSARAALLAGSAFLQATTAGLVPDAACTAAARGFVASTAPSTSPVLAAMETFLSSLSSRTVGGRDPVCAAAAAAFIDAMLARKSEKAAVSSAAKAYVAALRRNPGAGGACLAAAKAFIA